MDRKSIIESAKSTTSFRSKLGDIRKVALIVDDSEINRDILETYLHEARYKTVCAVNGKEGFKQFQLIRPSITFLDIVMPKISGLELLKEIKSINPAARVIMVSSYATQQTIQQAKDLNADWFLMKPFTKEKIFKIIERFENA